MLHHFTAFVHLIITAAVLLRETAGGERLHPFHVRDDTVDEITLLLPTFANIMLFHILLFCTVLPAVNRRPPQNLYVITS